MRFDRRTGRAVIAAILIGAPCLTATSAPGADQPGLKAFLSRYAARQGARETRYAAASADLGGDGRQEAVVYLTGPDWCGSGGCTTLVVGKRGRGWRLVSEISVSRLPIRVLRARHFGWRDLGVAVSGGGIMMPYEAALPFNGARYADNPTIPPAERVSGARGRIVIAEDAPEHPLK